jgi:hypothetical protein
MTRSPLLGRDAGPVSARNSSKGALVLEAQAIFRAIGGGMPIGDLRQACLSGPRHHPGYPSCRAPALPVINTQSEPLLHILVGCQHRFPSGEDPNQRYALAVRLWHSDTQVELHQQLYSRVRARAVSRLRVERRG